MNAQQIREWIQSLTTHDVGRTVRSQLFGVCTIEEVIDTMQLKNQPPPPGLYPKMSEEEYRAADAINWSLLKLADVSLRHLHHEMHFPSPPTDDMRLGTLIHTAVLEPAEYARRYTVMPDLTQGMTTKDGTPTTSKSCSQYRERLAAWEAEHVGMEIVSDTHHALVAAIAEEIALDPATAVLTEGGDYEVAVIGELMGVLCKGKLDQLRDGKIRDLKTTKSAHPRAFQLQASQQGYFAQLALYHDLARQHVAGIDGVEIVAVEKPKRGGLVMPTLYRLTEEDLAYGRSQYERLLAMYAQAKAANHWPGYGGGGPLRLQPAAFYERDGGPVDAPSVTFDQMFSHEEEAA